MRKLLVLSLCVVAVVANDTTLGGQKIKTAPAPVTVSLLTEIDDDGDTNTPPVPSAVYSNAAFTGEVSTGLSTVRGIICFTDMTVFQLADPDYAPLSQCSSGSPSVHAFGSVPVGSDFARQAAISWFDSVRGWEYSLEYGDVSTQPDPPNYVHILCAGALSGICNSGLVDTRMGSFPSGETTTRVTGPMARLKVRIGKGARSVLDLGIYSVPYGLSVTPRS